MGFYEIYFNYVRESVEKYGKKTVVLIRKGTFYEIYQTEKTGEGETSEAKGGGKNKSETKKRRHIGEAVKISRALGINLTRANGNKPLAFNNPYMCGFPQTQYDIKKKELVRKGWTVVKVNQKNKKVGKTIERFLEEVITPESFIDDSYHLSLTNNIVGIFVEINKISSNFDTTVTSIGAVSIDLSTGCTSVLEAYSTDTNYLNGIHELYRFISFTMPKNIHLVISGTNKECQDTSKDLFKDYLLKKLEIQNNCINVKTKYSYEKLYDKPSYQNEFLKKVFALKDSDFQTPIEQCGLGRSPCARKAILILFQHLYETNPNALSRLTLPTNRCTSSKDRCSLMYNAVKQLNLVSSYDLDIYKDKKKFNSLFGVIDRTKSILGKRLLKEHILNPITNAKELNFRYDCVDEIISQNTSLNPALKTSSPEMSGAPSPNLRFLSHHLKSLPDIRRHMRNIDLLRCNPYDFSQLIFSLGVIDKIFDLLKSTKYLKKIYNKKTPIKMKKLLKSLEKIDNNSLINATKSKNHDKYIFESNLFHRGVCSSLDKNLDNCSQIYKKFEDMRDTLNAQLLKTSGKSRSGRGRLVSIEEKEYRLYLHSTKAKIESLKHKMNGKHAFNGVLKNLSVLHQYSKYFATSDGIERLTTEYFDCRTKFVDRCDKKYRSFISKFSIKYGSFITEICGYVAKIDVLNSHSQVAIKHKYYRPKLVGKRRDNDSSFFEFKDIRHPIIERIIDKEYITNDIKLGSLKVGGLEGGVCPRGMLLYGANSSGKSSLTKAIGLNVLLAQIGCFTAGKLKINPFSNIVTRLSGNDNIFTGDSSFIVEMKELSTILKIADSNTLVLGDELCRGTEMVTGTNITLETIEDLLGRKSIFIFSTHMHHLTRYKHLKKFIDTERLKVSHLQVSYNCVSENLETYRKLSSGQGAEVYGFEVLKSLDFPQSFIDNVGKRIYETNERKYILNPKQSPHNPNKFMDSCSICSKPIDLESHHKKEQHTADENGFIDHYHKNSLFNLQNLCKSCHIAIHKTIKTIKGF